MTVPGPDPDGARELQQHLESLADEHPEPVAGAIGWLLAHPASSRPALDAIVRSGRDDAVTRQAIRAFAAFHDENDVAAIAALLHGSTPGLVWVAASALASHRSDAALHALINAVREGDGAAVEAASSALGVRADERARPTLEAAAGHRTESVRYRAVRSLGQLGAISSAALLRNVIAHDPSPDVRREARLLLASDPA